MSMVVCSVYKTRVSVVKSLWRHSSISDCAFSGLHEDPLQYFALRHELGTSTSELRRKNSDKKNCIPIHCTIRSWLEVKFRGAEESRITAYFICAKAQSQCLPQQDVLYIRKAPKKRSGDAKPPPSSAHECARQCLPEGRSCKPSRTLFP